MGADNVWSVQKLNDNKPWEKFIESPIPIHVEGRLGSFGNGQLRLLRCEAKFTIEPSRLRSLLPKSTVILKGRFKKEAGKVEFAVDDLKVVSSFTDQFDSRALKLKRGSPDEWKELGDWAADLSHFYDDPDLLKKSMTAYAKAIDAEYDALKATDAEGRFNLAKKVEEFKLPSRRKMELIHEGLRIRWQGIQSKEPPDLAAWELFSESLAEYLDGTNEPLVKVPRDLKESYDQEPISTYRKASDESRLQLHRLFFVSVVRKRLMQGVSADGRDGDQIAEKIERLIPEEATLAEQQRGLRLAYRVAHLSTETRADVENLAARLRERGQDDVARQALLQWIKSHELRLKGDGVIGLLRLADEYLSLLNNEAVAVEYLSDAYRIDPTFEEVKTKFASLGYQWQKSRWIKGNSSNSNSANPTPQAPTGISKGMASAELRKLLGEPGSLSRAITSRGITEVWSFGPAGGSRLVVRLEQKGRDTEPKVTAVFNTN